MQISYELNLSRFSDDTLNTLFKDGVITRHEYLGELNRRLDEKEQNELTRARLKGLIDGQQSR
jgi:hypothetical protein